MKGRIKINAMSEEELALFTSRMEQLLIERGVSIDHPELMDIMEKAGCRIEGNHMWFTKEVIDKAIAAVPEAFTLYSPDGQHDMTYPHPEGKFYTRTNTGAPYYCNVDGNKHQGTLDDLKEWYHLTNQLDNISFVALPSACDPSIPSKSIDVCALEVALTSSKKHIWIQPYEAKNVSYLIEMCQAAAGGADQLREKPIVSFISCSVPVLQFKYMDSEIILRCAQAGIPVQPCALPAGGANTPVTAQGTALAASADVLAQIVMLETICPGLPVIATPLLFSMDMRTTMTIQSNTEITFGRLICMQAFEQGYNIRCHSYGTGTDSLKLDGQNMIERTSLIQAMAMSDASVLGGAGQVETAMTINPLVLIADDEIFEIAQRLRTGLKVSDEEMDFEELLAGNDETTFLATKHTRRHYKKMHMPKLFYKGKIPNLDEENREFMDRVKDKYDKLTANPVEPVFSEETINKIHDIAENAIKELEK